MMAEGDISFPHLGIYLRNVPEGFTLFGIDIALYGVIICAGMILAVKLGAYIAEKNGREGEQIWNVSIWMITIGVIGARIYYVVFSWDLYRDNPLSVFNIRNGGLAIYGGIIAGFATVAVYMRIKKQPLLPYYDAIMYGLLLGQAIGRWGNFTNREAFGGYTDCLFAMRLPLSDVRDMGAVTDEMLAHMTEGVNYIQVHPAFLYESAWNLCLLALLLLYRAHRKFDGEIVLFYLGGYGLGRFLTEGLRTDQLKLPGTGLPVSRLLGISLFVCAAAAEIYIRLRLRKKTVEKEGS